MKRGGDGIEEGLARVYEGVKRNVWYL